MKRFLAFLMVVFMLTGLLAGCTPTGETPSGGETPGGSETPGGNDTPGGEDTPPAPTDVTYQADFKVAGAAAEKLTKALADAGITPGGDDAAKIIYAGEDAAALAASAKASATARAASYNDYAILCDGTNLALYGASDYATEQAIAYLLATYAKDGAITVPKDLTYTAQPALAAITVGDNAIEELTIVSENASCLGIANDLAKRLAILTGKEPAVSTSRARRAITLTANNGTNEDDFATSYTVSATASELIITAPTRASLSYAVQDFAASLTDGATFAAGHQADKSYELVHVDATDTALFKYCGTWQATDEEHPNTMVSYWNAAFVEIDFTGNAITVDFSRPTTFKIKMDDAATYSANYTANGAITFFAEGDGPHTLRIYSNDRNSHMYFAGAAAPAATTLSRTANKQHYIQFVGDSISDSTNSFSHRVGDVLGWDFSVTALSGIALETDKGYWKYNNGFTNGVTTPGSMADLIKKNFGIDTIGMEDAFFKLGIAQEYMTGAERELYANYYYGPQLDNQFTTGYNPDIVFIFLGTNDELGSVSDTQRFTSTYLSFVENILATYGAETQICVLQALTHSSLPNNEGHARYTVIRNAANALIEAYPENVTFIDRDIITTWNAEITPPPADNYTHPTLNGYNTLTEKIAELMQEYYG